MAAFCLLLGPNQRTQFGPRLVGRSPAAATIYSGDRHSVRCAVHIRPHGGRPTLAAPGLDQADKRLGHYLVGVVDHTPTRPVTARLPGVLDNLCPFVSIVDDLRRLTSPGGSELAASGNPACNSPDHAGDECGGREKRQRTQRLEYV